MQQGTYLVEYTWPQLAAVSTLRDVIAAARTADGSMLLLRRNCLANSGSMLQHAGSVGNDITVDERIKELGRGPFVMSLSSDGSRAIICNYYDRTRASALFAKALIISPANGAVLAGPYPLRNTFYVAGNKLLGIYEGKGSPRLPLDGWFSISGNHYPSNIQCIAARASQGQAVVVRDFSVFEIIGRGIVMTDWFPMYRREADGRECRIRQNLRLVDLVILMNHDEANAFEEWWRSRLL